MSERPATSGLVAIFDWIEFTMHNYSLDNILKTILEIDPKEFMALSKGKGGYVSQKIWNEGNVFVLYNNELGADKQGIHIIISGTGCRQYEKNHTIRDLIIRIIESEKKYKFTRIDIAMDDEEERIIDFDTFLDESEKGNLSSNWYKYSLILETRIADAERLGRTLYYGSKKSAIFMRVYDKYLEQKKRQKKHRDSMPKPLKEYKNWTRMEIVFRDQRAHMFAMYILKTDDIGSLMKGVLKNYIRFLIPPENSKDMRKRRWKTAKWWEEILGEVEKLKLTIKPAEKTIEDMKQFIVQQISPTIAAVIEAEEGDAEWLYQMILSGASRLKPKHKQAINQYLSDQDD